MRNTKGRRAIIVDSETGKEFQIDGLSYGEMPQSVAEVGAEVVNWLESNPPLNVRAWRVLEPPSNKEDKPGLL